MSVLSRQRALAAIAVASFGAVAVALITQYALDMQPCPWCVLQRLIFVALGAVALLGLAWRTPIGVRAMPLVILLLCSLGVAAALWQHFVAASSSSCNLTLADRVVSGLQLDALLPQVFQATASCAEAAVDLLGVPYALWSLALFVLIEAVGLALLLQRSAAASSTR